MASRSKHQMTMAKREREQARRDKRADKARRKEERQAQAAEAARAATEGVTPASDGLPDGAAPDLAEPSPGDAVAAEGATPPSADPA